MLKIGEFSKIVRVSARMLRYYEENGLLKPVEIDRFTGYRMYSMEQISELRRITELRDAGFGVEEIAETLPRLDDVEYMREILEKKRGQICETIAEEQDKLERIAEMSRRIINNITKENNMFIDEVELKKLESVKVLALLVNVPDQFDINKEQDLWKGMRKYIKENNMECGEGGYTEYINNANYGTQVLIGIPVNISDEKYKSTWELQFEIYNKKDESDMDMSDILTNVYHALREKGYHPINQIIGYLLTEDPTYITDHNNARSEIRKINRDELLKFMVQHKFSYAEIGELPLAATIKYSGNIREGYQAAMGKIVEWMQTNGYQFFNGNVADGLRCYRIETPLNEENPDDYLTEMQVAVEKV